MCGDGQTPPVKSMQKASQTKAKAKRAQGTASVVTKLKLLSPLIRLSLPASTTPRVIEVGEYSQTGLFLQ